MTFQKIERLERQLDEARREGLAVIDRAEKWRKALTKISEKSACGMAIMTAEEALLNI